MCASPVPPSKSTFSAALVLAAASALAGCGSAPRHDYSRPDASTYERDTALAACKYHVRLNRIKASEQDEMVRLCMHGKGYR